MPIYPNTKLKTIKYDSPSGKINIGKWVPPFEKVKDGFGFVGVLAEDTKTGQLQCHVCGQWYELLTAHIYAKHQLLSHEYADKFGLFYGTALKSKRIRKRQSEVMLGMRMKNKKHRFKFAKGNKASGNRKGWKKPAEQKNKHGICDLQVVNKIKIMKQELGRTPALTELIDKYGGAFATLIHTRYGGYLKLLKTLKYVPVVSSFNPRFKTEKAWREHLLQVGRKALRAGKRLVIKKLLPPNEQRYIYKHFKSFGNYKKQL